MEGPNAAPGKTGITFASTAHVVKTAGRCRAGLRLCGVPMLMKHKVCSARVQIKQRLRKGLRFQGFPTGQRSAKTHRMGGEQDVLDGAAC